MASVRTDQLVSAYLNNEPKLNHGIEYEVETYLFDFRTAFLERKIDWIKKVARTVPCLG